MSGHANPLVDFDPEGAKLGMWLFLFTEIILFGGMFLLYAIYLSTYPAEFHSGGNQLDALLGGINTVVLITSSFFVALSVTALQKGNTKFAKKLLWITILCALAFLCIKFVEWSSKYHHGLFIGLESFDALPNGEKIFFGLYYCMTGLHGLHVIIGGGVLGFVIYKMDRQPQERNEVLLENAGLYWHLVDLIWIYLFPLFYLVA